LQDGNNRLKSVPIPVEKIVRWKFVQKSCKS